MRKKDPIEQAVELLAKLLKKGNDLEAAMVIMHDKGVAPMAMVISLTKILDVSLEEADEIVLNSKAYSDVKEDTLRTRNMAYGIFMDEADEIIQEPNGRKRLRFDLDKEE
jgi:hypothetical protein